VKDGVKVEKVKGVEKDKEGEIEERGRNRRMN